MKKFIPQPVKPVEDTSIALILRDIARKRAVSLRWNTHNTLAFYALLVTIGILQFSGISILIVMALASLGLLVLWLVARSRWKKVEKKLFQEELDNYQQIVSMGQQPEPNRIMAEPEPKNESPLSNRELEVLARIAEGMINKQIAVSLGISTQTVKNHISNILGKLDVEDRTSAVVLAVSEGWINISPPGKSDIRKIISGT